MSERVKIGSDVDFIRYLKKHGGDTMKKCFQCATCSVSCELSPKDNAFPRKEMIWASWGMKDKLMSDPDVWLCHGCMDCSQQCPRSARPADLMGAIRSYVYRAYAVPKFLGDWLADPKHLPKLFIVAFLAIFLLVFATNGYYHDFDMNFFHLAGELTEQEFAAEGGQISEEVKEHMFVHHNAMSYGFFAEHGGQLSKEEFEAKYGVLQYDQFVKKVFIQFLFIPGNILIFFLAYLGLSNYWKNMKLQSPQPKVMGFSSAAWKVLLDLLGHDKFEKCPTNSNRRWGHFYVFYGFLGTMIATGIVVLGELYEYGILPIELFHLPYPMGMGHPVKILGLVSGTLLFIGAMMLIVKRIKMAEREGKNTYNDWLFLWVVLGVGFTGLFIVLSRMPFSQEAKYWLYISNIVYFIHLTLVFFLLWYMPYSKFGHMIYRFTGLIYLKMHGRDQRPDKYTESCDLKVRHEVSPLGAEEEEKEESKEEA